MTDDDFLQAFVEGSLSLRHFHHCDHLRVAWLMVRRMDAASAVQTIAVGLRRLTAAHGHEMMYHDTLTQFWVRLVAHMAQVRADIVAFDVFLAAFPQALDTHLPSRHWRHETLWGPAARQAWVEPDLLALPW